jgi:hypothetical protein
MNASPAIVTVPVRGTDAGFAAIDSETISLPLVVAPFVTTSQLESLVAVHEQLFDDAVSVTSRFWVAASTLALEPLREYVHEGGVGGALPLFQAFTSRFASTEPNPVTWSYPALER